MDTKKDNSSKSDIIAFPVHKKTLFIKWQYFVGNVNFQYLKNSKCYDKYLFLKVTTNYNYSL